MENDRVVIKVEGKVSVQDFRTVVDAFAELMMILTAETNSEAAVDWIITDLKFGNTVIESQGIIGNQESANTIHLVVGKYESIALSAARGTMDQYSDQVRKAVQKITSVINGKIPRILMGTAASEMVAIEQQLNDAEAIAQKTIKFECRPNTRTAIKGQVVLLDDKHATCFTLREASGYDFIRCYPGKEHRNKLGDFWEKKTWIMVEGMLNRSGDLKTMTQITDIVELPDVSKGGWRAAIGVSPRPPQAKTISAVEAVRKVRDGEA